MKDIHTAAASQAQRDKLRQEEHPAYFQTKLIWNKQGAGDPDEGQLRDARKNEFCYAGSHNKQDTAKAKAAAAGDLAASSRTQGIRSAADDPRRGCLTKADDFKMRQRAAGKS